MDEWQCSGQTGHLNLKINPVHKVRYVILTSPCPSDPGACVGFRASFFFFALACSVYADSAFLTRDCNEKNVNCLLNESRVQVGHFRCFVWPSWSPNQRIRSQPKFGRWGYLIEGSKSNMPFCVRFADVTCIQHESGAYVTQMLRAPAVRGARNKGCFLLLDPSVHTFICTKFQVK
jgi:hypothetical protein